MLADGTLGAWSEATPLPSPRERHAQATDGEHVWVLGGYGGEYLDEVLVAAVGEDGRPGAWTATTPLPIGRLSLGATVHDGRVYVFGGWKEGTSGLTDVSHAEVNPDGTLGAWVAGPGLPTPAYDMHTFVREGRMYVLWGSYPEGALVATIAADGSLGAWESGFTPTPRFGSCTAASSAAVYALAGRGASNVPSDEVSYAPFDDVGRAVSPLPTTPLPDGADGLACVLTGRHLFVAGAGFATLGRESVFSAPLIEQAAGS